MDIGEHGPQGRRVGSVLGQDKQSREGHAELGPKGLAVDLLGPGSTSAVGLPWRSPP